jgi:hypothetical protein
MVLTTSDGITTRIRQLSYGYQSWSKAYPRSDSAACADFPERRPPVSVGSRCRSSAKDDTAHEFRGFLVGVTVRLMNDGKLARGQGAARSGLATVDDGDAGAACPAIR